MITAKIKIGKRLGKGLECAVYKYGNDKVIKIYLCRNDAEYAIEYGRIAFENGIGPEVFSDKPFVYDHKSAIICERVKTAEIEDFDEYDRCSEEPIDERLYELKGKYTEVFGDCFDIHIGNLGWSKDGQLIMIDFGPESTPTIIF